MDIYTATIDYVSELSPARAWPEFQTVFQRIAAFRPKHWLLPVLACEAVGGSPDLAIPAVAAIACAQIGIVMLDDMLDQDPKGEYHQLGLAISANLAAAFQSTGLEAVSPSSLQPETRLKAIHSTNHMMLTVALGQHLDIEGTHEESAYWRVVERKSASFFSTALYLGALLASASEDVAYGIQKFGLIYGEMIQIHDDLGDTMAIPASSDWTQHRTPLPILFAQTVNHPARSRFLELYRDVSNPMLLSEAQNILVKCGAISYCVDQLCQRHLAAQKHLSTIPLVRRSVLDQLSQDVVDPILRLFQATGVDADASFLTKSEWSYLG